MERLRLPQRRVHNADRTIKYKSKITNIIEPRHDKTNKMSVRPAKTQISLGIRPVWSASSLCTQWVAKDPSFLNEDSEGSDQTGRMPRMIWVIAGHTLTLLVLSCRGSYHDMKKNPVPRTIMIKSVFGAPDVILLTDLMRWFCCCSAFVWFCGYR